MSMIKKSSLKSRLQRADGWCKSVLRFLMNGLMRLAANGFYKNELISLQRVLPLQRQDMLVSGIGGLTRRIFDLVQFGQGLFYFSKISKAEFC